MQATTVTAKATSSLNYRLLAQSTQISTVLQSTISQSFISITPPSHLEKKRKSGNVTALQIIVPLPVREPQERWSNCMAASHGNLVLQFQDHIQYLHSMPALEAIPEDCMPHTIVMRWLATSQETCVLTGEQCLLDKVFPSVMPWAK